MDNEPIRYSRLKKIRIEWKIDGASGSGRWIPDKPDSRKLLQQHVEAGNSKYGLSTHWIVWRYA